VADLNDPQFVLNPYYERILTDAEVGNKTYLAKVTESNPTFFSCWLGNNDVLLFAVSGGQVPITPPAAFNGLYNAMINGLTQNGAQGVVANIPSVTSIPFLTTLGPQVKATLGQNGIPGIVAQSGPANNPTVIQVPTGDIAANGSGSVLFPLTASALPVTGGPARRTVLARLRPSPQSPGSRRGSQL
jgi:hypothetical protein